MTGRERVAAAMTRLISGGGPLITGVTALCLTGAVLLAGAGLADAARGLRSQLAGSEILTRLTGGISREHGRMEPKRAGAFLRYLNAMAPAVINLEVLPDEQVNAFNSLYDTAAECDVALRGFTFHHDGPSMEVSCWAGEEAAARKFYEAVKASPAFSSVHFSPKEDLEEFMIICVFND